MIHIHINFCMVWFNRSQIYIIPWILKKLCLQRPLTSYASKNYINTSFKVCISHAKFWITMEYEMELSQEFWLKWNSIALYWATCTQIASILFLMINIVCISFCEIIVLWNFKNRFTRNRDHLIPKILEKVRPHATFWAIFTKNLRTSINV